MAAFFECPSCQTIYPAAEHLVGRQVRCGKCGEMMVVPDRSQWKEAEAEPAPPPVAVTPPPVADPQDDEPIALGERAEREEAEMDMTPMVDVTFLLLIFFMVTAAFSMQKSLEIPKPNQDEASQNAVPKDPEEDPECVTVCVDEFNTYRVVTVDWDEEAPSEQELLRKLREARNGDSAGNVPTRLLVKAHTDSLLEKVVAALDAGAEVGMEKVQLMTVEEME